MLCPQHALPGTALGTDNGHGLGDRPWGQTITTRFRLIPVSRSIRGSILGTDNSRCPNRLWRNRLDRHLVLMCSGPSPHWLRVLEADRDAVKHGLSLYAPPSTTRKSGEYSRRCQVNLGWGAIAPPRCRRKELNGDRASRDTAKRSIPLEATSCPKAAGLKNAFFSGPGG